MTELDNGNNLTITRLKIESGGWRETNNLLCPTPECKNFSQILAYEPVIWRTQRFRGQGYILVAETHAHHCEDCGFAGFLQDVADEIDQRLVEKLVELGLRSVTKP